MRSLTPSLPPASNTPARSQSLRFGPVQPFWGPSDIVLPEDFGGAGDGSTDNAAAFASAVAAAKIAGAASYLGMAVGLLYGSYITSAPIVLPRTGSTPTNVVHLKGKSDRNTLLKYTGTSGSPIEWEDVASRTQHQRIENMTINLPSNVGVQHAIHYALSGTVTTEAHVSAQWMSFCHFENIVIEAQGSFQSGGLVKLEGGVRYTDIINVWGDPSQGAAPLDVLLFEFDHLVGSSGNPPGIGGDSVGFQWGKIVNPISTIRRGGYSRLIKGRVAYSTIERGNCNGGRSGNALYGTHILNGFRFLIDGLANEGQGESAQMRFESCRYWRCKDVGLGTPDATDAIWLANHAYSLNDRVVPTTLKGSGTTVRNAFYLCTTAGTSAGSEPTWPASGTVSDGGAVWTFQGAAVGDGLQLIASTDGRWERRHATGGPVPFSRRLVKLITADASSKRNQMTDFDLVEQTAGTAANEFTLTDATNTASGNGLTGSLGSETVTPYSVTG